MSPRTVFSPYARLFAAPGRLPFFLAGWLARVPISTTGLGAILLVESESGSYGLAGLVAGTIALAFSVASPQWARAMDSRGQGRVLRWAMAAYLVVGLAFVAAVLAGTPHWSWFALAALVGASEANVGSAVRARWAHVLPDADQRQTAFAFESVVDECVFVIGPPLVTFLAALVAPPAGFLTGLVLGVVGGWLLAGQESSQPPVHAPEPGVRRSRTAALTPAVVLVAVVQLAVGTVFGAMDVVVVGFAEEAGSPTTAGAALAVYAGGSLVAGLVYGVARLPGSLLTRFVGAAVLFAVAAQALLLVSSLSLLIPVAFLAGLTIAPVLVAGISLVESRTSRASLNEAIAWATVGVTLGLTLGSAVAGLAVDAWGAETAFAVPAAGAALAGVLALGGGLLLHRLPEPDPAGGRDPEREQAR
ncbi:MFS transporter [Modestobacter sp. I12A-02628]|uniref:MFS transporter n=1 Tax=Goekera deserti TaxID=2497753 RepID=A0A7K3WJC1_9ACTN|nr:MFS transporter [Goekera deserti]MPR00512.1 MFS transporter [Goekera deserti]NDI50448.1 MFS transporter [Goekera deserti]NEL56544.1 MFS transporter [Goekera deserti]